MVKWNEEGAPNVNLSSTEIKTSNLISKKEAKQVELSEELSAKGNKKSLKERDEKQHYKNYP